MTKENITYREIDEKIGLTKESGITLVEEDPDGSMTSGNIEMLSLSADGSTIGGIGGIWHYDVKQGWQNEYLDKNGGDSYIHVFNATGNIAGGLVGSIWRDRGTTRTATLWIKDKQNQWKTKNLADDGFVWNINRDGSIATGLIFREVSITLGNDVIREIQPIPTLWTGEDWNTEINLAESIRLRYATQNTGAYAINAKGDIVGGIVNDKPVIWSGNNWQEITWLDDKMGFVLALNAKGDTAAGTLNYRPMLWSGEKWQIATPLASENEYGEVRSLSADGTVAAGVMNSPVLWRIVYSEVPDNAPEAPIEEGVVPPEQPITGPAGPVDPDPDTPKQPVPPPKPDTPSKPVTPTETAKPTTPEISKPAEKPPVVTAMIDVENTQKSILKMGHDTFELFSLQFGALRRLQEECVAGKGEICYALQHNYATQNGNYDNALNLRVGYGFTDNLTFGVNFDRSLHRSLPDTYRRLSGNGGVGVFGHYQLPYRAYIAAGIGWDYYRVQAQRPLLANTEFAPTKSRVRGLAWNVTVGQDFTLSNDSQLGWYLAYRQTEIKRDGYRENVPGFPVEYGAANLKDNAIAIGAKFALPITPKLSWISAVEFERRLGGESPVYSAKAQYVGDMRYQPDLNHSRWNAQSGLRYAFAPNLSLSLTPFWGNSIVGNNQWGTKLTLEGRF